MAVKGSHPAELRKVLDAAVEKALTLAAIQVQNEARRNCPVDTGRLRGSIAISITGAGANAEARVGSNLDYALAVEEGHGPIVPKKGQFLRFPVKGGAIVFTKRVRPVAGTHFLRKALHTLGK